MAGDFLAGGRIEGNRNGGGSGHAGLLLSRQRADCPSPVRNVDPKLPRNKASAYPVTCTYLPEWGCWQGCALPPKPRQATAKPQQKLVSCGMAGWGRWRETP
jgi:hypothetical protein